MELADLDAQLAPWRAARAASYAAKGAQLAPFGGQWHRARARGARRTAVERTAQCGTWECAELHCKGCGIVHRVKHRCRVSWACEACRKAYWLRWSKRLRAGLGTELLEAAYRWRLDGRPRGRGPRLVLLTLTIRHSGDVALDRARISKAWVRFRAWLHKRIGAPAFAKVWEFTDGTDGKGHVHLHVATVWPFVEFGELHEEWKRATEGHGTHVDVSRGKHGKPVSSKHAAGYLAKYATKGSVSESLELLGAWVRAITGRRRVTTSRRLTAPPEPFGCWTCYWPRWRVAWIRPHGPSPASSADARAPPAAVADA